MKKKRWIPNPKKRIEILEFIIKHLKTNKKAPTIRQIMRGVGLKSTSGVYYHLEFMGWADGKGFWNENKKRLEKEFVCPCCQRPFDKLKTL